MKVSAGALPHISEGLGNVLCNEQRLAALVGDDADVVILKNERAAPCPSSLMTAPATPLLVGLAR